MVLIAAEQVADFSLQFQDLTPGGIPARLAETRGWSIRFEGIPDYIHLIHSDELRLLYSKLGPPTQELADYLARWDEYRKSIDPLLLDQQIPPGQYDAIENVRVVHDRSLGARAIIERELLDRRSS